MFKYLIAVPILLLTGLTNCYAFDKSYPPKYDELINMLGKKEIIELKVPNDVDVKTGIKEENLFDDLPVTKTENMKIYKINNNENFFKETTTSLKGDGLYYVPPYIFLTGGKDIFYQNSKKFRNEVNDTIYGNTSISYSYIKGYISEINILHTFYYNSYNDGDNGSMKLEEIERKTKVIKETIIKRLIDNGYKPEFLTQLYIGKTYIKDNSVITVEEDNDNVKDSDNYISSYWVNVNITDKSVKTEVDAILKDIENEKNTKIKEGFKLF